MPAPPWLHRLPNLDNHHCFGCSPINPNGLGMEFYAMDNAIASWIVVGEQYCGWHGVVHGGIIAAMLDEIMGRGAFYLLKRLVMTKSIVLDFLKPVATGKEIRVEGRVRDGADERNAVMEGVLYNHQGQPAARATGHFKLFSVETLRRQGGMDDINLLAIENLIQNR